jgi:hypothetical protein
MANPDWFPVAAFRSRPPQTSPVLRHKVPKRAMREQDEGLSTQRYRFQLSFALRLFIASSVGPEPKLSHRIRAASRARGPRGAARLCQCGTTSGKP